MARSTGIVLAAGGLAALDLITGPYEPDKMLRTLVGTIGAALVSAGLDKVVPGFGTGAATLLLVAVVLDSGPRVSQRLFPPKNTLTQM